MPREISRSVQTAAFFLGVLVGFVAIPGLVYRLLGPNVPDWVAFMAWMGPQYLLPFSRTYAGLADFRGAPSVPLGFEVDVFAWLFASVVMGLFCGRLGTFYRVVIAVVAVPLVAICMHGIDELAGWTFVVDGT